MNVQSNISTANLYVILQQQETFLQGMWGKKRQEPSPGCPCHGAIWQPPCFRKHLPSSGIHREEGLKRLDSCGMCLSPARQWAALLRGDPTQLLCTLHLPLTSRQTKASCTAVGQSRRFALTDSMSCHKDCPMETTRQVPHDLAHTVTRWFLSLCIGKTPVSGVGEG